MADNRTISGKQKVWLDIERCLNGCVFCDGFLERGTGIDERDSRFCAVQRLLNRYDLEARIAQPFLRLWIDRRYVIPSVSTVSPSSSSRCRFRWILCDIFAGR
jgi:hypothetical protein